MIKQYIPHIFNANASCQIVNVCEMLELHMVTVKQEYAVYTYLLYLPI